MNKSATKKRYILRKRGFTLLETLTAIFILSITLVSFIPLVVLSLQSFQITRQRYIAEKIAQEGMELVISKRDNHVLCIKSGSCPIPNWKTNLVETSSSGWEVATTRIDDLLPTNKFSVFSATRFLCLKTTEQVGKFGYCSGSETPLPGNYTRQVRVTQLASDRVRIQSIVSWRNRIYPESIKLEEILFGLP